MSKRDAEIYRRAAERIAAREVAHSCLAIKKDDGTTFKKLSRRYAALFNPTTASNGGFWLNHANDQNMISFREMHKWRITALCFMAAMCEAGDV